jgi:malate synthase
LDVIPPGDVASTDLLNFPEGPITDRGLRQNISVGLHYLASWLGGNGAAGIDNLMEDVATAEIARSQVWQWVRRRARTDSGDLIDQALVEKIGAEIMTGSESNLAPAWELFREVALGDEFVEFLTLPAYERLE